MPNWFPRDELAEEAVWSSSWIGNHEHKWARSYHSEEDIPGHPCQVCAICGITLCEA
jgi:hypothetical protein